MFKILFFICELYFYAQYIIFGILIRFLFFKTKVYYENDTSQNKWFKGGAVVISNHRSFLDGLAISYKYFPKRFHVISEDFFKNRLKAVKFIAQVAGSVFIDKEVNDLGFIDECKKLFEKNRPVIIFPEGGFQYTYEPSKFYTGYIMLSVKTKTKIVPIANDLNYGLFKRVHLLIGNTIDLSQYSDTELNWAKRKEINKEIYERFLMLFYLLKRKKAEKFKFNYVTASPKPGDVIRISMNSNFHYGIYLNDNEVIQFGEGKNNTDKEIVVNSVSFNDFCGGKVPEVRIINKRLTRKLNDIEKYAKSCLGQGRYSAEKNNCLDFANRVTLNI